MANVILAKRSAVSGKVPTTSDLSLGELAINTHDGNIFIKKDDGSESIVKIGADADTLDGHDSSYFQTVSTNTTNFDNNLSSSDNTVQKALDTLDDLSLASNAAGLSTNTTNFDNNLSSSDNTVQKALDTLDDLSLASNAAGLSTDTTNFNNNLSSSDDTVQKALDTLDDLSIASNAAGLSTDTTNFNNNLSSSDDTVQKALDTLDDLSIGGENVVQISANYNANADDLIVAATAGAALASGNTAYTITCPSSPSDGDIIRVMDANGNAQDRPILIDRNGNKIDGDADDLTCDVNYFDIKLVYNTANTDWQLGGK